MPKRIIALVMTVVIAVTTAVSSFGFSEPVLWKERSIPSVSTAISIFRAFRSFTGIFGKNLDVTYDETMDGLFDYISQESGFDVKLLAENIPDVSEPVRLVNRYIPLDLSALKQKLYEYRDVLYSEDRDAEANVVYAAGVFVACIDTCKIYAKPRPDKGENVYEICLDMTFNDGSHELFGSGVFFDTVTGNFTSYNNKGMIDTGFEFNMNEMLGRTVIDCWQRNFGFCIEYDILCYILPIFNYRTRRFRFDYAGKEWMIQIWKGNYVIANGAEVGLYKREPGSVGTYYDCAGDEDLLNMSMSLLHGDDVLYSMPEQPHWWLTGFKFCNKLYHPASLTLGFTIEMKDEEMLRAFTESIDGNIYHDVTYTVDGLKVSCIW